MTTGEHSELEALRHAISETLFHSTVMGGIQAIKRVSYDYGNNDLHALRAYQRLFTIDEDPFPIIAVVRILQDHGGRHVIPELTTEHISAYHTVTEAQQTHALHTNKRQGDADMHNHREVCSIVLRDLTLERPVCSIILDRGITDAKEVSELLADMTHVQGALFEGML